MIAMIEEFVAGGKQRQQRAETGRGQGGDDGQWLGEAFVEHAEHQVDGQQRGTDQQRLASSGDVGQVFGVAGELGAHVSAACAGRWWPAARRRWHRPGRPCRRRC